MKAAPLTVLLLGLVLVSCTTTQAPIPADAPSEIYFQRAQAASDQSHYDEALKIYRTFLEQRPDASREDIFAARYEVAVLLLKQGHTAEAETQFQSIVADYDDLEKSAGAAAWVKVLATKKLQELTDKKAKK